MYRSAASPNIRSLVYINSNTAMIIYIQNGMFIFWEITEVQSNEEQVKEKEVPFQVDTTGIMYFNYVFIPEI